MHPIAVINIVILTEQESDDILSCPKSKQRGYQKEDHTRPKKNRKKAKQSNADIAVGISALYIYSLAAASVNCWRLWT